MQSEMDELEKEWICLQKDTQLKMHSRLDGRTEEVET